MQQGKKAADWVSGPPVPQSTGFLSSVAYAPFGETYASSGASDVSFTGMNPDTTGNGAGSDYDFLFRPYSTQGRWPTPDPSGLGAVNPSNPQSWNRYAYVLNNPLRATDPLGLDCVYLNQDNNPMVVIGDCLSDSDNGVFVDGTVDQSLGISFDFGSGTMLFYYTPDGSSGAVGYHTDIPDPTTFFGGLGWGPRPEGGGFGEMWSDFKNLFHWGVCTATAPLVTMAQTNGGAIGYGLGGSIGVGLMWGLGVSGGVQLVADPNGNVGIAFSGGYNPGFGVLGAGAIGGVQSTLSNGKTIYDLRGGATSWGASGAIGGAAIGIDVATSKSADSLTLTTGVGLGGKGTGFVRTGTAVPNVFSTSCGPK